MSKFRYVVNEGFTLIELMIVIAILGILAAIAIVQYQNYIIKAQVGRAVNEISVYKSAVEDSVNNGKVAPTNNDVGYVRSSFSTTDTVFGPFPSGIGDIVMTLDGDVFSAIQSKTITLSRTSDGTWECSTTIDARYRPQGC